MAQQREERVGLHVEEHVVVGIEEEVGSAAAERVEEQREQQRTEHEEAEGDESADEKTAIVLNPSFRLLMKCNGLAKKDQEVV